MNGRLAILVVASLLCGTAHARQALYTLTGDVPDAELGLSVAVLGDVNGDGHPDFVAGAPAGFNTIPGVPGYMRVFSGGSGATLATIPTISPPHLFARSLASIGDVDGDGIGDFTVGLGSSVLILRGFVLVYSGATLQPIYGVGSATARDDFGFSTGLAGDADNDGFPDFVVGAKSDDQNGGDAGAAYLFSGKSGTLLKKVLGVRPDDQFGTAVSGAGDVDGDGADDWMAGAPFADSALGILAGQVKVYSGKTGLLLRRYDGPVSFQLFGSSVALVGDTNGDGRADHGAGSPGFSGGIGKTYVFSGADGSVLHAFSPATISEQLGTALCGAGDVDSDGCADILIGAPSYDSGTFSSGRIELRSGADGSLLFQAFPHPGEANLGQALAGGFDLNGDGRLEIVVGAPSGLAGGGNAGTVKVYSVGP